MCLAFRNKVCFVFPLRLFAKIIILTDVLLMIQGISLYILFKTKNEGNFISIASFFFNPNNYSSKEAYHITKISLTISIFYEILLFYKGYLGL